MSTVQVKGKVVDFGGIEKSKDNITILGSDGEKLTITFKTEECVEDIFNKLGFTITQHLISGSDKTFDVVAYLEQEELAHNVMAFSNGESLKGLETGALPEVMYRYNNRFGIIKTVEQPVDLSSLEVDDENENNELHIVTNSGKIQLTLTGIKTINVVDFVENYIKLMVLKSYTYNTPINLDEVLEELSLKFLLQYKVTVK